MGGRFSSSAEVFRWMEGFINHERGGASVRDFRLERMEIFVGLAGHPEGSAPVIHVAGSKGKGSVTAMIAGILEAGGRKTARYASPHVSDYRERVSGGRDFYGEEIYTAAGEELAAAAAALESLSPAERRRFSGGREGNEGPTFFELMTLYYFLCARLAGAEALAVETGLGGRLDATNIVDPLLSVITLIEKEHTEYLGTSLAAIAGEKAGIIKRGKPLVLASQEEEALRVFQERSAALSAPLRYFPLEGELSGLRQSPEGTVFTLRLSGAGGGERVFRDLAIPIPGETAARNAGLAVLAALCAFPDLEEGAARSGLAALRLPARFERLSADPPWIVDGAHTPASVAACLETFTALYGEGGLLLFGCAADKDAAAMARILLPRFSRIVITAPGSFKKSAPPAVHGDFLREAERMRKPPEILLIPGTGAAIRESREWSRRRRLPALCTGSFYLAGELRAAFSPGGK